MYRCKRHKIVTPINIGVSLKNDFFYDIKSCSTELTNLDEVALFNLLLPISSYKRQYLSCPIFNHSPLFFSIGEFDLV